MGGKKRDTHLYPAKITRPTDEHVLPRKRLFRQIDLARKKPVLWLSGPAGSGKTTLICSYIDDRALPCLWYRLNELDNDSGTAIQLIIDPDNAAYEITATVVWSSDQKDAYKTGVSF